jgi:ribonuclease HI
MGILEQFGITYMPKHDATVKVVREEPAEDVAHKPLICFIDGSCIGNGSKHAKAGYGVVFPDHPSQNLSEKLRGQATNNRAEYTAYLRALDVADVIDPTRTRKLCVNTDSKLLMDSVTKWIVGWKKRSWVKADGKPVLNRDLLEQIDVRSQTRPITWRHVYAHTGRADYDSVWNAKADELAKAGAKKSQGL